MPDPKYNEPFKNSFIDKMSTKKDTTFYKNINVDYANEDIRKLSKTNPSSITQYGREYGFKGPKGMEVTMVADSVVAKYAPNPGSQGPVNKVKKTYEPSYFSTPAEKPKTKKESKTKPIFYKNK